MVDTSYGLDANVFIEAAKRYYAFDIFPKFWTTLVNLAGNGSIQSIDRVRDELLKGRDELAQWFQVNFSQATVSTTDSLVIESYSEVMKWALNQAQFLDPAKHNFARGADGWLIAYARQNNCVVVTQERFNPNIKRTIPIPNVCRVFEVRCIDTFEMLRELRVRI